MTAWDITRAAPVPAWFYTGAKVRHRELPDRVATVLDTVQRFDGTWQVAIQFDELIGGETLMMSAPAGCLERIALQPPGQQPVGSVCPTCDGYGAVTKGRFAVTCPNPTCRGRVSTEQFRAERHALTTPLQPDRPDDG